MGDLEQAIDELRVALPGWWYSLGECSVSCDATVGPDAAHCPPWIVDAFDDGFDADLRQPSTVAEALRSATAQAVKALSLE